MAEKLITVKEPKAKISGLTYENIVEDVYNLIKDNPDISKNVTDYTSADSVRMLTEIFAWITDQLSQRIDIIGNELYLDTVEERENLLKMLKIIGYEPSFPECARANFNISINNYGQDSETEYPLSIGVSRGKVLSLPENPFKTVSHSVSGRVFEAISFDDEKNRYEYFTPINIKTKKENSIAFYEGRTSSLTFTVDTSGYFTKTINEPVIKNSVRIFYANIIDGESVELKQVDNFFGPETTYSDVPVFRLSNIGGGKCRVIFPNRGDVREENLLKLGDEIIIIYRTGGGTQGNIGSGEIVSSEEIWLKNNRRAQLNIKNNERALGGKNEETVEEIKRKAPKSIKNRISAVTAEDYEFILREEDSTIKDIKVYGENNIPKGSNLISSYGYTRNPLDVWLFIIKENANYSNDIPNVTDFINDIPFQTLELNERMNEIYQVNKSSLNLEVSTVESEAGNSEIDIDGENITNYNSIRLPESFIEELDIAKKQISNIDNIAIAVTRDKFKDYETDITGENSEVNFLLEKSYYYDNSEKKNKKTLSIRDDEDFIVLYEYVLPTIENAVPENREFSGEMRFYLDNNTGSEKKITIENDSSLEDTLDELNMRMNLYLNNSYATVVLKDNIVDKEDYSAINQVVEIEITQNNETIIYEFTANNNKWSNYPALIKNAEDSYGNKISDKYECDIIEKNYDDADCYILVLFSREDSNVESFEVKSDAFGLTVPVKSRGIVKKGLGSEWVSEIINYFEYSNGVVSFLNPHDIIINFLYDGFTSTLLGLDSKNFINGVLTLGNKRILTIRENNLIIKMANTLDILPDTIYITGLWGTNKEIRLGEFYENIENNKKFNANSRVKKLLKRNEIKNIYNTVLRIPNKGETDTNEIDVYNSLYEIKATRRRVNDQTYFQIGNDDTYAEIAIKQENIGIDAVGDLYIKVDGKNYSSFGIEEENNTDVSVPIPAGNSPHNIENYATTSNGYVKFNIPKFSGLPTSVLLGAIRKVFSRSEGKILIFADGDRVKMRTETACYYSRLDFGETTDSTMEYLFGEKGEGVRLFLSSNSYIPLTRIDYLKFSLKEKFFEQNFNVRFAINGLTKSVNTGSTPSSFFNAIRNDETLSELLEVRGNDIFLADRSIDNVFSLELQNEDIEILEKAKKMFADTEDVEIEEGLIKSVKVVKKTVGDYYIKNTDNGFFLVIENGESFPIGDLYFHMLEDYRYNHLIEEESKKYTDEYDWNSKINPKKMLCVSHVFRQPRFIPFSVILKVLINKNVSFGKKDYYSNLIYDYLIGEYNIYTSELGKTVYESEIRKKVLNISGVMDVEVEYLGFNVSNLSSSKTSLEAKFDEKLIIASKEEKEVYRDNYLLKNPVKGLFVKVEYAQW